MAKMVFSNEGVAHAWARGAESARSGNGNFYSAWRLLYSYGPHFVVGVRLGVATFALNTDGYSSTTTQHKTDARRAVHGTVIHLPALGEVADALARIARDGKADKRDRDTVRAYMVANAAQMDDEEGVKLESFAGLSSGTFVRAKAKADRLATAKAKRDASNMRASAKRLAINLADMTSAQWKEHVRKLLAASWGAERNIVSLATDLRRSRIVAKKEGLSLKRLNSIRARLKSLESLPVAVAARIAAKQRDRRAAVSVVREWLAKRSLATLAAIDAEHADIVYNRLAVACETLGRTADGLQARRASGLARTFARDEREARYAREEAERTQTMSERREAWLAGDGGTGRHRFSDAEGGALLRIIGDTLETSWGADIPLAHAVKAFRFVKLVRERGTTWEQNGKVIRVGHYHIDRIDQNGFDAGCHRINWPEIERVAKLAGVFNLAADDSAVTVRES